MNGAFAVAGLLLVGVLPRRRCRYRLASFLLVLAMIAGLAGCGGGNGNGVGGVQKIPGTTPGTYTFTIGGAFSAGGVAQSQAPVSVTIQ